MQLNVNYGPSLLSRAALHCLLAAALASGAMLWADATCTPPAELKARLQDKPAAAVYNDLGIWFAGKEQYACSAEALATSLQMEPQQKDMAHIAFMFGVSLLFSGETRDAIAALEEVEKMDYRDIKLHLVLASALDSIHSSERAEAEWRAAIAQDWENSTALDGLSNNLNAAGNLAATITLLDDPKVLTQRTATQSLNLGMAYAKTGKLAEAANALRDGLNTSPDAQALGAALADVLVQMGNTSEAIAVLQLQAEMHPENAQAQAELGILLAQAKDYSSAKMHLEKAIALGDGNAEIKENLEKVKQALEAKK